MRKITFLFLLFSFWSEATQSQHIEKGWKPADELIINNKKTVKKKVRSASEYKTFSYSNSRERGSYLLFDKKGNLIESRWYTHSGNEGNFHFKRKFFYNREKRLIKATQTVSYDSAKIYWENYQYDKAKGLTIITGQSNAEPGAFRRIEQQYNQQGQHIKTAWYEPDSLLSFTHFNTFDGNGNKIATTTVWGPWKIEMFEIRNGIEIDPETQAEEIRTGIKFDPEKELEEESEEGEEDFRDDYLAEIYPEEEEEEKEPVYIAKKVKQEPDSSTVFYEYNAKGKVVEYKSGASEFFYKVIYKYNKKDQLVETRQMDKNGRVYHKETFHYNKAGLLIAMDEYYDGDKPVILHKYTYTFY